MSEPGFPPPGGNKNKKKPVILRSLAELDQLEIRKEGDDVSGSGSNPKEKSFRETAEKFDALVQPEAEVSSAEVVPVKIELDNGATAQVFGPRPKAPTEPEVIPTPAEPEPTPTIAEPEASTPAAQPVGKVLWERGAPKEDRDKRRQKRPTGKSGGNTNASADAAQVASETVQAPALEQDPISASEPETAKENKEKFKQVMEAAKKIYGSTKKPKKEDLEKVKEIKERLHSKKEQRASKFAEEHNIGHLRMILKNANQELENATKEYHLQGAGKRLTQGKKHLDSVRNRQAELSRHYRAAVSDAVPLPTLPEGVTWRKDNKADTYNESFEKWRYDDPENARKYTEALRAQAFALRDTVNVYEEAQLSGREAALNEKGQKAVRGVMNWVGKAGIIAGQTYNGTFNKLGQTAVLAGTTVNIVRGKEFNELNAQRDAQRWARGIRLVSSAAIGTMLTGGIGGAGVFLLRLARGGASMGAAIAGAKGAGAMYQKFGGEKGKADLHSKRRIGIGGTLTTADILAQQDAQKSSSREARARTKALIENVVAVALGAGTNEGLQGGVHIHAAIDRLSHLQSVQESAGILAPAAEHGGVTGHVASVASKPWWNPARYFQHDETPETPKVSAHDMKLVAEGKASFPGQTQVSAQNMKELLARHPAPATPAATVSPEAPATPAYVSPSAPEGIEAGATIHHSGEGFNQLLVDLKHSFHANMPDETEHSAVMKHILDSNINDLSKDINAAMHEAGVNKSFQMHTGDQLFIDEKQNLWFQSADSTHPPQLLMENDPTAAQGYTIHHIEGAMRVDGHTVSHEAERGAAAEPSDALNKPQLSGQFGVPPLPHTPAADFSGVEHTLEHNLNPRPDLHFKPLSSLEPLHPFAGATTPAHIDQVPPVSHLSEPRGFGGIHPETVPAHPASLEASPQEVAAIIKGQAAPGSAVEPGANHPSTADGLIADRQTVDSILAAGATAGHEHFTNTFGVNIDSAVPARYEWHMPQSTYTFTVAHGGTTQEASAWARNFVTKNPGSTVLFDNVIKDPLSGVVTHRMDSWESVAGGAIAHKEGFVNPETGTALPPPDPKDFTKKLP